ncbi:MAG: hypothetical protein HYX57_01060 [Chloroflexi bacterium]|nr:hypothetical protein [Chloroflexota bacterium]
MAAAWALLLGATTLLTSAAIYGDALALGGLRAAMADAPAASRAVVVESATRPEDAAAIDAQVRPELERLLAWSGGEVARVTRSGAYADAAVASGDVTQLTEFTSFEGIERHATLADGRWANPGATPQEATLSEGAAKALGLSTGDRITLASRLQAGPAVEVVVTGIWRPDPADAYWLDPDLELTGSVRRGSFTTVGPFAIPDADFAARSFGERLSFEWRALPDPAGFRIDDIGTVRVAAEQLDERLQAVLGSQAQFRVVTDLSAILATVDRAALVSRTGVLLLVVQFAVLAAYAIILVAGMLADRRRAETALIRSRGGSSGHLAGMALLEAIFLTGLAALLAPPLSVLVVRVVGSNGPLASSGIVDTVAISRDAILVDIITALAGAIALVLPMIGGVPNLAGVRAAISRQAGRTLAQRLGLDLVLVAAAAIGLWQLRIYGAPLTRNARGVLGVDPLLVAAPGIGLLAGAVIATRLIPRAAEIGQHVLERDRGLVAPMGGRGLARRPLRYTRSALLLMLAAALGTFASAHVATWTRSQVDQAAYQAGADVRIEISQKAIPARAVGGALRAIPGVEAAMAVDRLSVDSGRGVRGGPLLAVDAALAGRIVNRTPDADGAALGDLFRTLAASRPETIGVAIPTGTRRLSLVLDAAFTGQSFDPENVPGDPPTSTGVIATATVVLEDGDGRLYRVPGSDRANLIGAGQRLVLDLSTTTALDAPLAEPLRLRAIDLDLASRVQAAVGTLDLVSIAASTFATGDAWTALDIAPGDPGWSWFVLYGPSQPFPYAAPGDRPWRIRFGQGDGSLDPIFGGNGTLTTVRLTSAPAPDAPIAAIASRGFLDLTGGRVGDIAAATLNGVRRDILVIGALDAFPSVDPTKPFLIVDGPTLAIARFAAIGDIQDPGEWWLSAKDQAGAATAITAGVDPGATVVTTEGRTIALATDPVPLGVIGVLGLGSAAAMIFAAIGFVVSATISTRERVGEFALLRALGLSGRQLAVWLSLENAVLLTMGLVGGVGLGLLLAWLVLPFSTLTSSGAAAVPSPIVVIPWATLAPIVIVAGGVFVATLLVLRGQLLHVRIGDVLRGRDE